MMADRIRNWYLRLSPEKQNELLQELIDCDKERRVDYREGLAKKIESDMISMMNQLGELIQKEDSLFKGRMMQCGSSYNQTKVGQPDEMDFAFQWDLSETRSEKIVGTNLFSHGLKHFERLKGDPSVTATGILPVDTIYLTFYINNWDDTDDDVDDDGDGDDDVDDNDGDGDDVDGNDDGDGDDDVDDNDGDGDDVDGNDDGDDDDDSDDDENGIEPRLIHVRFDCAVNDALMKMTLLPDWEHGGFASPDCTGTRENGPALMMQFNYNLENGEKLQLTVDLVLAIDLREIYDGDLEEVCVLHMGSTWQHELLKEKHFLNKVLTKIHHSVLLDTTFAERVWLSTMDSDHPVKIAVRIFKILNQMALQHPDADMKIDSSLFSVDETRMAGMKILRRRMANYDSVEDKERAREFAKYQLRCLPIKKFQYYDMKVPEGERFVDLGECLGNRPYLKSHVFQSVVLALYALRCTQHPDIAEEKIWSKDDIPTIVVNVMMTVQQFLDGSVDKVTNFSGSRDWHFPQLYLESEGRRYRLHQPESLCLDVYRGETVKQHFARMWHLFQQLANQHGADEHLCGSPVQTTGKDKATPLTETGENVVHLLSLNISE